MTAVARCERADDADAAAAGAAAMRVAVTVVVIAVFLPALGYQVYRRLGWGGTRRNAQEQQNEVMNSPLRDVDGSDSIRDTDDVVIEGGSSII